jgi:hypothetical protein
MFWLSTYWSNNLSKDYFIYLFNYNLFNIAESSPNYTPTASTYKVTMNTELEMMWRETIMD